VVRNHTYVSPATFQPGMDPFDPLRRDELGASGLCRIPGVDRQLLEFVDAVQEFKNVGVFSPATCSLRISRENDPRWKKWIVSPMFIVMLTTTVLVDIMLICFVKGALVIGLRELGGGGV
jgi:hypothetical protein